MTRPHARAGAPYVPPMPVDFAGDEPTNSTLEHDYEQFHEKPVPAWKDGLKVVAFIVVVMFLAFVGGYWSVK